MFVCCECCVLSGRGLCDELITRPEEFYRLWCVVVCDLETSRMRRPWPALGRSATKKNVTSSNIIYPVTWRWPKRGRNMWSAWNKTKKPSCVVTYLKYCTYSMCAYMCIPVVSVCVCVCVYIYIYIYIGCPRRNVPDFGKVFLMLKYTDITQNTYVQSWTVTEIMAREVWNFDSCYTLVDYQIHIKTGRNMWFLLC